MYKSHDILIQHCQTRLKLYQLSTFSFYLGILLLNTDGFVFAYIIIFKLLTLAVRGEGDGPKHRIA